LLLRVSAAQAERRRERAVKARKGFVEEGGGLGQGGIPPRPSQAPQRNEQQVRWLERWRGLLERQGQQL
jgi:hypothetical protein